MKISDAAKTGFWQKTHHLDRMTLRELVVAYFQYPAIMLYLALAVAAGAVWVWRPAPPIQTLASIALAVLVFPLAWYVLHRWVLHSQWMWKHKWLAPTWKRIHYDHHQDPNNLEVLFGSPFNVVPTVAIATIPLGYMIGGTGAAAIAFGTGMVTTCVNEFFHCIQHLSYKPRYAWIAMIKQRHMAHHFHDESGNFGITNYWWDRLFGTLYERVSERKKSPTVFNLGYTAEVAEQYPYVADLSGGVATGHPRRRGKG